MIRIQDAAVSDFERDHAQLVRSTAAECTLFLKKDETFPLSEPETIALFGNGARKTIKGGTGSGDVNVRHFTTIEEGLVNAGFTISSNAWLDAYDDVVASNRKRFADGLRKEAKEAGVPPLIYGMGKTMPEPEYDLALDAAGDTAIYVLARNSGEGSDRKVEAGDIYLTASEKRDILFLNEHYNKFMLVLNVGGMVELSPVSDVKNVLLLGQLGMMTGDVFADILLGRANPSGKLAMTWAALSDYPSTDGFGDPDDTLYKEGIFVGYRYFDTQNKLPAFPFGYGLSYTQFSFDMPSCAMDNKNISVSVLVKNTGHFAGREVVQLYASAASADDRPYQELKGFHKTRLLQPGESETICIAFPVNELAVYDKTTASYMLRKGDYCMRIGNSSRNTLEAGHIQIEADSCIQKLSNICPKQEDGTQNRLKYQTPVLAHGDADLELLKTLSDKELAFLCLGNYSDPKETQSMVGAQAMSVAGAAGETTHRLSEHGIGAIVMADGPAGIRLSQKYCIVDGLVKECGTAFGLEMMDLLDEDERKKLMGKSLSEKEKNAVKYYQYCTAIPIGTSIAQSWNTELAERYGDIIGDEMERFGIHLWLAPALNIQRSPLCGRNFEYYSEDPLISGEIAAAITIGVQKHERCGVTIKHFAANNQETNRYASNSIVDEQALREIYLKGFEICVKKAAPASVMTSYNLINGEHTANSYDLITTVLRGEWSYPGIVMSDWNVTTDIMLMRKGRYAEASAAGCIKAGNDLVMPGAPADLDDILDGLAREDHPYHITRDDLLACALRILKMIRKYVTIQE